MRVLVTGATGFLGGAICRQLAERGAELVAFARTTSRTAEIEALGVRVIRGDLTSARDLEPALDGVTGIVHSAGGGFSTGGVEPLYRSNRDTTRALVRAARRASSVERFVLISSMAAHGPAIDGRAPTSAERPRPQSHYGRAKAEAEALVLDPDNAFAATVLRPPIIHGAGDDRLLPLFRSIARGVATLPRTAEHSSWIHVEDCAAAAVAALVQPHATRATFGVADGPPRQWTDVVAHIGDAVGRPSPRIVRVPVPVLFSAAAVSEVVGRVRRRPVVFTRDKVADLRHGRWAVEHEQLPATLDWAPRTDFATALREMAEWFRERGQLG